MNGKVHMINYVKWSNEYNKKKEKQQRVYKKIIKKCFT